MCGNRKMKIVKYFTRMVQRRMNTVVTFGVGELEREWMKLFRKSVSKNIIKKRYTARHFRRSKSVEMTMIYGE